jgi:microcystin-dependent protein
MKYGGDPVGNQYVIGETGGEEQITISSQQMPVHTHTITGSTTVSHKSPPAAGFALATSGNGGFFFAPSNSPAIAINPGTVSVYAGGNQPHTNIQPYLGINWCIALQGVYPARN